MPITKPEQREALEREGWKLGYEGPVAGGYTEEWYREDDFEMINYASMTLCTYRVSTGSGNLKVLARAAAILGIEKE